MALVSLTDRAPCSVSIQGSPTAGNPEQKSLDTFFNPGRLAAFRPYAGLVSGLQGQRALCEESRAVLPIA